METQLKAIITANSDGLINSLNQATQTITGTAENWKDKLSIVKQETSNIETAVKSLEQVVFDSGNNITIDSEQFSNLETAIDGASDAINKTISEINSLNSQASELGVSFSAFQEIKAAAEDAGTPLETIKESFSNLGNVIRELANSNKEAKETFSSIGVSMEDLSSLSMDEKFMKVANAIRAVSDETQREKISNKVFGKSFAELKQYIEGYEESVKKARNAGGIVTQADVQQLARFAIQINNTRERVDELSKSGNLLDKTLSKLAKSFHFGSIKEMASSFLGTASVIEILKKGLQSVIKITRYVFDTLYKNKMDSIDTNIRNADSLKQVTDEYTKQASQLDNNLEKLKKLNNESNAHVDHGQEMARIVSELTQKYGELGIYLDSVTGKYQNLDIAMAAKSAIDNKRERQALDQELKELYSARETAQDTRESEGVWWKYLLHRSDNKVTEALQKEEEINKRIEEILKKRHELSKFSEKEQMSQVAAQRRKADRETADKLQDFSLTEFEKKRNELKAKFEGMKSSAYSRQTHDMLNEVMASEIAKLDKDEAAADEKRRYSIASLGMSEYEKQRYELEKQVDALKDVAKSEDELATIEAFHSKRMQEIIDNETKAKLDAEQKVADKRKALMEAQEHQQNMMQARRIAEYNEEITRLQAANSRIQSRLSSFGFAGQGDEILSASKKERARLARRIGRTERLDESITDKLQRMKDGENVKFTGREERRIQQYNRLKDKEEANNEKIKQLEAAKAAMEAAQSEKDAARQMQEAAKSVQDAAKALRDAAPAKTKTSLRQMAQRTRQQAPSMQKQADKALPRRMPPSPFSTSAASVMPNVNYSQQLTDIIRTLKHNVFIVR